MRLSEVVDLLPARVVYGTDSLLAAEIGTAAASDLMSDILARVEVPDILLTRLNNTQVVRTASVFGIKAVIVVRGRPIDPKIAELAKQEEIVLLSTESSLFESCGKLYSNGVRSTTPTEDAQQA
ncbi:MAG: hypothetical protein JSW65_07195 [Candidatus Bipolaricaulota bacterium]|nr:MAG: hypothetical protein JSW65_07195 [Candidatus Bipolaricaulota bacterium]